MTPEDELEAIMKALPEEQREALEDLLNTLTEGEQAQIWRLAQARTWLRTLDAVRPAGAMWSTPDEVPQEVMDRVSKGLPRMPDGTIKPSEEDVAAATLEYVQGKKRPQDN